MTDLQTLAVQKAKANNVDPALFLGLVTQESSWNPRAVSPAGAIGLCQLMPATAKELGVKDPFDPAQNLAGGARYLAQLLSWVKAATEYQRTLRALWAYNWGIGNVNRYVLTGRGLKGETMPAETINYPVKVMGYQEQWRKVLAKENPA